MLSLFKKARTLPLGSQIYDAIMREIEPDLTTANIKKLDKKYKGETQEEKDERLARYHDAYEMYDSIYAAWLQEFKSQQTSSRQDEVPAGA